MIAVLCTNNHYFDLEKSDVCPICGAAPLKGLKKEDPNKNVNTSKKKSKFGSIFSKSKKNEENDASSINNSFLNDPSIPTPSEQAHFAAFNNSNSSELRRVQGEIDNAFADDVAIEKDKTTPIWGGVPKKQFVPMTPPTPTPAPNVPQEIGKHSESIWDMEKNAKEEAPAEHEEIDEQVSLAEQIRQATADNSGKTVSYFSTVPPDGAGQSNASHHVSNTVANPYGPVVGWIVAIKGPHFGEALSVYAGRNDVGRNADSKVPVTKDMKVSREKHGWIIYEPKGRKFFVAPGDSSGIAYLNDEAIFDTRELNAYDMLEFGDSRFVFVPLCGERFSWEDYID